jgi:hypothetical protein
MSGWSDFKYKNIKQVFLILFLILSDFVSCRTHYQTRESVVQAMKKYDSLILKMDVDSIAMLYTPDGNLGNIAQGRDSIRNFLNRFRSFKVLYQESAADTFSFHDGTAMLKGVYHQKTIIPPNDTVSVTGRYDSKWIWIAGSGWHIKSMETTPAR